MNANNLQELLPCVWWLHADFCHSIGKAVVLAPSMKTEDRLVEFGNENIRFQFVMYCATPLLGRAEFQKQFESGMKG